MVDIKGLDKARVLKALYDHSHVQGSGFLQAVPDGVVTVEYCAGLLAKHSYFDYLHGRVLKVDLSGDEFDERLYDRGRFFLLQLISPGPSRPARCPGWLPPRSSRTRAAKGQAPRRRRRNTPAPAWHRCKHLHWLNGEGRKHDGYPVNGSK